MDHNQYPFLKAAISITKILSYLAAGLGIVGSLIILFGKNPGSAKLASIGVLTAGGVYFLVFYLLSEFIRVLLDMHHRLQNLETNIQSAKIKKEIH